MARKKKDPEARQKLWDAISRNNIEEVAKLIESGNISARTKDQHGNTTLHCAAQAGHLEVFTYLLEQGADTTAFNEDGYTILHRAVEAGHFEIVSKLIGRGVIVDALSVDGISPLHFAAKQGNLNIVTMLLDQMANVNAKTIGGRTPLDWAAWGGHADVAKQLLENAAGYTHSDQYGDTAMHWAARGGSVDVLICLMDFGASFHVTNKHDMTPFFTAIRSNNLDIVRCLLTFDPSLISTKASHGLTPLQFSMTGDDHHCSVDVVRCLAQRDADAVNKMALTPSSILCAAARDGWLDGVKCLLELAPTNPRLTVDVALEVAMGKQQKEIEAVLIAYRDGTLAAPVKAPSRPSSRLPSRTSSISSLTTLDTNTVRNSTNDTTTRLEPSLLKVSARGSRGSCGPLDRMLAAAREEGQPNPVKLGWKQRLRIAYQAAASVATLHATDQVHGHLTASCILVDTSGRVIVADPEPVRQDEKYSTVLHAVNAAYLAPEVCQGEAAGAEGDVYAFGVVLWELLTLWQPWGATCWELLGVPTTQKNAFKVLFLKGCHGTQLPYPTNLQGSPNLQPIIEQCWAADPSSRPLLADVADQLKALYDQTPRED